MNYSDTHAIKVKFLHNTAIILIAILTLASVDVKSVKAFEVMPVIATFGTATQVLHDVMQERGLQVPEGSIQSQSIAVTPVKTMSVEPGTAIKYTKNYTVTAYNSVPWQTDSTPCISADGSDICKLRDAGDMSCAAALPFGTKIHVPGFGTCTVRDRLAPKFSYRIDLYFGGADQVQAAREWGKKHVKVSVLDS